MAKRKCFNNKERSPCSPNRKKRRVPKKRDDLTGRDVRCYSGLTHIAVLNLRWRELVAKHEKKTTLPREFVSTPYVSKGGTKAVDKIPGRRQVVPAFRPFGYKETALTLWKKYVSPTVMTSYNRLRDTPFKLHSRKIMKNIECDFRKFLMRKKKKELDKAIEVFIERFLKTDFLHDDLKASQKNPAVPASYAPSAFNVYYSRLVNDNEPRCDHIGKSKKRGYSLVWSYGSGSGVSTIGLDPATRKVFKATENEFAGSFAAIVLDHMEDLMRLDPKYDNQLGDCKLNVLSIKVYWGAKNVNQHTDIDMTKYSGPKKNNSQKPGTPVFIYTVGDPKKLVFHRKDLVPAPKNSSYVFADTPDGLDFTIGQFHKDAFILDYEDENREGGYFYKHSSNVFKLIDPDDSEYRGFTISLMGRSCVDQVWVSDDDNSVFSTAPKVKKKDNVFLTKNAKTVMGSEQHRCVWAVLRFNVITMFYDYYRRVPWDWDSSGWNPNIDLFYPIRKSRKRK